MTRTRLFCLALLCAPLPALAAGNNSTPALAAINSSAPALTAGAVVTTLQVRAELVAHAPQGVAPGQPLQLGLQITHQPHWHTYWKNPGDSGLPTTLGWQLPAGMQAGAIAWPTPQRLPIGPLMNHGYEGTVLLPVAVTVPAGFAADKLDVKLHAEWLVCKEVCIPESGDFVLSLPTRAATAQHAALFAQAAAAHPQTVAGAVASATVQGDQLVLRVAGLPAAWQGQALQLFFELPGLIQTAAAPVARWETQADGTVWTARVPTDPQRSTAPTLLPVVLTRDGVAAGLALPVALVGAWPAAAAPPPPLPALGDAQVTVGGNSPTPASAAALAGAALLALVGGLLLNLMPCVFPVLSLKVLGFATPTARPGDRLLAGLAYTGGVVLSFVALAALLLALRAGGQQLGWGFQLQQPGVVAALAALFTLIGLNLVGVFEVGTLLPSSWATARAQHPAADAALTGVLAVAVASPCTAPFMGASLGVAMALPTWQALAVFAALGLGMALPFLAASAWPPLARALPRPGVWMQHFKTVMALPMFATVVWLVWVLGQQVGIDGAAAVLALLVVLAFVAWALGSPTLGPRGRWGFGGAAVALLVATAVWVWPALQASGPGAQVASTGATPMPADSAWQPWSADRVAQALAQQQPVFVDFTAAWCVTCQFNKRTTLADAAVKAAFAQRRVLLLRADWTRQDATITAELTRLQRSGVPVYALYTPGQAAPRVLSEILSVAEVQGALAALP
jgi:thiol:disulfide interchange protein/DsbC/DsbD-like thiol-disulfide interchange protein